MLSKYFHYSSDDLLEQPSWYVAVCDAQYSSRPLENLGKSYLIWKWVDFQNLGCEVKRKRENSLLKSIKYIYMKTY